MHRLTRGTRLPRDLRDSSPVQDLQHRLLLYAASRLTERDRMVIHTLADHQVLTTSQVCDLAFNSERHTTQRMNTLYRLRVVDRFRPLTRTGSAPYHWILDEAGAAVVATDEVADLGLRLWARAGAKSPIASVVALRRLRRLLELTPKEAAPPGPTQVGFFEAPPGPVHAGPPPRVKVKPRQPRQPRQPEPMEAT